MVSSDTNIFRQN